MSRHDVPEGTEKILAMHCTNAIHCVATSTRGHRTQGSEKSPSALVLLNRGWDAEREVLSQNPSAARFPQPGERCFWVPLALSRVCVT